MTKLGVLTAATLTLAASQALAVDGVIEINQARALAGGVTPSDIPGFPVTIDTPGSYRLTGNLVVESVAAHGIDMTSSGVTLDLNGFSIQGPGSNGTGNGIYANAGRVRIKNGRVSLFGAGGVKLATVGSMIEDVDADNNDGHGIDAGDSALVKRCSAVFNTGSGIRTGTNSRVVESRAVLSGGDGIEVGENGAVTASRANANGRDGIYAHSSSVLTGNVTNNNSDNGLECDFGRCTVVGNVSEANGQRGIDSGAGALIKDNVAAGNDGGGIISGDSSAVINNVSQQNEGDGLGGTFNMLFIGNTSVSNGRYGLDVVDANAYGSNLIQQNALGTVNVNGTATQIGTNVCNGNTGCP